MPQPSGARTKHRTVLLGVSHTIESPVGLSMPRMMASGGTGSHSPSMRTSNSTFDVPAIDVARQTVRRPSATEQHGMPWGDLTLSNHRLIAGSTF